MVKRIQTEIRFDSDGEAELIHSKQDVELSDIFSNINEENILEDLQINTKGRKRLSKFNSTQNLLKTTNSGNKNILSPFHRLEDKERIQFKVQKYAAPGGDQSQQSFSYIDENDYFAFVEDYDKFIGEFVSDRKLNVVRGFVNSNEYNRIFYTKMKPQRGAIKASVLMVHGFGHSGKYLEVSCEADCDLVDCC